MDLKFGAMGLYSNSTDSQSTTTATCTDMSLTNLTSTSTSSTPPVAADIDIDVLFRHPASLSSPSTSCTDMHRRRNILFSGGTILPKSGVSGYADKGGIVRGGYTDELGMHSAW